MEKKRDGRRDVVMTDVEALVPKDHLLRKVEKVMDYDWLYERLSPYYCEDNGRPGIDPVVLIKMALLEHLCGLPSLRQTHRDIEVNVAYRWFLGYNLLEKIPHFATVSYAFCRRFPLELSEEIFTHILNKALNNKAVEPSMVFIDGTHLKASANKKKFQKEQVAKTAKVYARQLLEEVNEEREKLGKPPIEEADEDDGPSGGGTVEKTVSTTDPDCGMFVKGSHERQFAYEAHTACDKNGYVLGVEVTAGNIHDSVAWDALYDQVTARFPQSEYITMDAAYKTPWIVKKILDDGKIPLVPYTRYKGRKDVYKPWEFTYDEGQDCFICPQGCRLRHTTTSKDGKRFYRSTPKDCRNCPCREACGANAKGQRVLTTHIWQEYLDLAEQLRKSERGQEIYALRKETIERVFADAKDKHGMRFTHRRGLARVSSWVRLKFAAMNLKKLALWGACHSFLYRLSLAIFPFFLPFPWINRGFFDRQIYLDLGICGLRIPPTLKNKYSTQSRTWVQWLTVISPGTCAYCADMQGHILCKDDPSVEWPPVHENCHCQILPVTAFPAGTATEDGLSGVDYYLFTRHCLPENYMTQDEAKLRGWKRWLGNLWDVLPGVIIGGDQYYNWDGRLPQALGRIWYEADFDYNGGYRNWKRIVFSNDGLMFVTYDHYLTFSEVYWEDNYDDLYD